MHDTLSVIILKITVSKREKWKERKKREREREISATDAGMRKGKKGRAEGNQGHRVAGKCTGEECYTQYE